MSPRVASGSQDLRPIASAALTDVTFVQLAGAAVTHHRTLTLEDLHPITVWVLHGAQGRVGHLATGTFLDLWADPASGLVGSELPATLGRADPAAEVLGDPVLLVRAPRICGSGIQYDMEVVEGAVAERTGACVLLLGCAHLAGVGVP